MIRFACRCKHAFAVEDDMAGGFVQCPACGRLNDVPTLDDLPNLTADGTYDVQVERPHDNPYRLAELNLIYGKSRRDADGDEIDLRIGMDQLADTGPESVGGANEPDVIPLKDDEPARPAKSPPRYDPVTGELIRPLELKGDEDLPAHPSTIPMAKRAAALPYASRGALPSRSMLMVELLMPANVVVLFVVLVMQVAYQILSLFPARIFRVAGAPIWILFLPLGAILLSHYGNVLEDSGPAEYDELQRPLRDFDLFDDIWWPFARMFFTLMLCYGPAFLATVVADRVAVALPAALALTVLGTVMYPAVVLTVMTSGTLLNLRPDRLLGVVSASPLGYLFFVVLWAVVGPMLLVTGLSPAFVARFAPGLMRMVGHPLIYFPMLAVSVYAAHLFFTGLGRLYRARHAEFGWVLQEFIRDSVRRDPRDADARRRPHRDTRQKLKALRDNERREGERQRREAHGPSQSSPVRGADHVDTLRG